MTTVIASRTPEGVPGNCPVCAARVIVEPSRPAGDAPCPICGSLVWFEGLVEEYETWDERPPWVTVDGSRARRIGAHTRALFIENWRKLSRAQRISNSPRGRQTSALGVASRRQATAQQPISRSVSRAATWVRSVVSSVKSGAGSRQRTATSSYGDVWDSWLDG
jgi:hypothetical protein